jgi:CheY-like chemotaxis protein
MPQSSAPRLQLLIVDDDPISVRLLKLVVERHWGEKAQVTDLTDPQAALAWLAQNPCEILITDLQMPEVGGLELHRCARNRSPMIQAIFVSAEPSPDTVLQAAQDGASDFLVKPVQPADLVDRLEKAEARLIAWRRAMSQTMSILWPLAAPTVQS